MKKGFLGNLTEKLFPFSCDRIVDVRYVGSGVYTISLDVREFDSIMSVYKLVYLDTYFCEFTVRHYPDFHRLKVVFDFDPLPF